MVHKGLYIILALFLGGVGIHKFYAGKFFQGFLYLALCWTGIPLVLSLFDTIGGLFRRADSNGNIYV